MLSFLYFVSYKNKKLRVFNYIDCQKRSYMYGDVFMERESGIPENLGRFSSLYVNLFIKSILGSSIKYICNFSQKIVPPTQPVRLF